MNTSNRLDYWTHAENPSRFSDLTDQLGHVFTAPLSDLFKFVDKRALDISRWSQLPSRIHGAVHSNQQEYFWILTQQSAHHSPLGFIHVQQSQVQTNEVFIGYVLAPQYQGKGYASEAVAYVLTQIQSLFPQCTVITAHCATENIGSQRVLEKCQFTRAKYLKNHRPKTPGTCGDSFKYQFFL